MTATELASSRPARPIQFCKTRNLCAATTTNHYSRLFDHTKSPSQPSFCLQVCSSYVYLRMLSASVSTDVATLCILWVLRDWDRQFYTMGDMELKRLVLLCGLMVSFLLLLLTAYRMRKDSSPAKGLVTIGTIVLLVVKAVGSSLFLLALIQASPH